MGPPPCAPVAAVRKVDAATAAKQVRGLIAFPLPWNARLANSLPDLSSPTLGPWFTDLLKVLALAFFIVGGVNQSRLLFGKKPPVDEQLKALREEYGTLIAALSSKLEMAATRKELDHLKAQIIPREKLEEDIQRIEAAQEKASGQIGELIAEERANIAVRRANGETLTSLVAGLQKTGTAVTSLSASFEQFLKDERRRK
jgi:hypothetical protein